VANTTTPAEGYREETRQFVVSASVRCIHDSAGLRRCWRLTWPASDWRLAKAGYTVALYDAAGPIGEASAPWEEVGMITRAAGTPRMTSLLSIWCR
jgi:hypothetical protein